MAEEKSETEGQQEKKGRGGTIITLMGIALGAGAAGFFAPKFIPGLHAEEQEEVAKSPEVPSDSEKQTPGFVDFGQIVVNLKDGKLTRYLKISITLQVDKEQLPKLEEYITGKQPILKSWLLSHVSDKSLQSIAGKAGQNRLRREIRDYFNAVLFPDGFDRIKDVLFQDFNVQ